MPEELTDVEIRVLGSLVEKERTTPEYYPLTLNALTAACNQKSNRDPVVSYDESAISAALENLREKNLVYLYYGSNSRTVKYKHMLPSVYGLGRAGTAILAVLFLRGHQTIGELRERTSRMHEFSGLAEVQETLDALSTGDEKLVAKMERRAGQKEARYAHLFSSTPAVENSDAEPTSSSAPSRARIDLLQDEVIRLSNEVAALKATFEDFRRQFE